MGGEDHIKEVSFSVSKETIWYEFFGAGDSEKLGKIIDQFADVFTQPEKERLVLNMELSNQSETNSYSKHHSGYLFMFRQVVSDGDEEVFPKDMIKNNAYYLMSLSPGTSW